MTNLLLLTAVALFGTVAGWLMTVPLHSYKELRPKTPRDVASEVGSKGEAPMQIQAAYRQARCPQCHHSFTYTDVVPIQSWLRGCPDCDKKLAWTVPLLQIGMPVIMTVTAATLVSSVTAWAVLPFLWFILVLGAIALVDLRIWLIPYWMPWVGSAVGLVLIAIVSVGVGVPGAIVHAAVGGVVSFLFFFVLWIAAPGKLGFGDVRLALLLGLFLAWLHPLLPIYGLLFGSLLGLGMGLVAIARRSDSRFPFGPALALGAVCAVWAYGPLFTAVA